METARVDGNGIETARLSGNGDGNGIETAKSRWEWLGDFWT
jgi:hypothetical protein